MLENESDGMRQGVWKKESHVTLNIRWLYLMYRIRVIGCAVQTACGGSSLYHTHSYYLGIMPRFSNGTPFGPGWKNGELSPASNAKYPLVSDNHSRKKHHWFVLMSRVTDSDEIGSLQFSSSLSIQVNEYNYGIQAYPAVVYTIGHRKW